MKIKMITLAAGPDFNAAPGQILEVDDKIGKALVKGGYAEPAEPIKNDKPE